MTSLAPTIGLPAVSDDALLALIGEGDRRAFAELYDRTAPRVLGLVTRCLRAPAQSEEVTQEVYLELWQNAARFDGSKGKALTWILTVARRRAIDRVRASQSSRDRDMKIGIRDQPTAFDVVSEAINTKFVNAEVRNALTQITLKQRETIELAYFSGLTPIEISERLGVKLTTIKTRLRDGLIGLRRVMPVQAA